MSKQKNYDRSKLVIPAGTMEDFKRPGHNDFATTSELIKREYTGYRHNSLTDNIEIWKLGCLEAEITRFDLQLNKFAIQDKMEEIFGLHVTKDQEK